MKIGRAITLGITAGLLYLSPVFAQTPTCTQFFGGGDSCVSENKDLTITKQVKEPEGKYFHNNLTDKWFYFQPDHTIVFRLTVKNITNNTLSNIEITDTLSAYLNYQKGDGTFDASKRTFTGKIEKLDKGQSKSLTLTATVKSANSLPDSPSPLCLVNIATAKQNNKQTTDTSTFCLTKQPVSKTQGKDGWISQPNGPEGPSVQTKGGLSALQQPSQTKGGLPIVTNQNPPRSTPSTGTEDAGMISIFIFMAAGLLLRKKLQRRFTIQDL